MISSFVQRLKVKVNIINEVVVASEEGYNPELDDIQLQEDQDDCKLDFNLVTNEMKEAAQEAISKQTITAYKGYIS
jgi:hypothetical protein